MKLSKLVMLRDLFLVASISLVSWSSAADAQSKTSNTTEVVEFRDDRSQAVFKLPKAAVIDTDVSGSAIENSFLGDGKYIATVQWNGMKMKIADFTMQRDVHHVDWLTAYANFAKLKVTDLKTLNGKDGLRYGFAKMARASDPDKSVPVLVTFAGGRGYMLQGITLNSEPLLKGIASSFTVTGDVWGSFDPKKEVQIAGRTLSFYESVAIKDISQDDREGVVVSSDENVENSSLVYLIKTGLNNTHQENATAFEGELDSIGFKRKVLNRLENETIYQLQSRTGLSFVGYVKTQGGASVALIAPALSRSPHDWMSGKYYYVNALRSLK